MHSVARSVRKTPGPLWVNDTHSALNHTAVSRLVEPCWVGEVAEAVARARRQREPLAISGSRHAMGGQQFLTGGTLLDMRHLNHVRWFDRGRALMEVEAGITWPDLIRGYLALQRGPGTAFGIRQKQTGADRLTLGGAVSANIHGRGLRAQPFVADVEGLEVVTPTGEILRCSRTEHAELFRHVVGGYGLFGVVTAVTLRLVPRVKVERCVARLEIDSLIDAFDERIAAGHLYGDFQFATAPDSPEFLRTGVLSSYRPVAGDREIPKDQRRLSQSDWNQLLTLAHRDKRAAFEKFSEFYLATHGQLYWSDTHQLNLYLEDYHGALDHRLGSAVRGSEMITELYVPRPALLAFMNDVRRDFRLNGVDFIYGTIRLIEAENETALPWARESYACVIFNLHIDHRREDVARVADHFRRLIDLSLRHGGSYFLTYHRFASASQVEAAHPAIRQFLATKRRLDPEGVFQSDWYRHLAGLFE
ncbi:MAG TPA: FAD-binding oxidoreductase [Steroidobacteraceae bacterium]|nr:FAD-binding oxidoreductase [Steroidobacteraceae bacterium]